MRVAACLPKLNLPVISWHSFRHTLTTWALKEHPTKVVSDSSPLRHDFGQYLAAFVHKLFKNAPSTADDGLNPMPPMFCYLKPYYNDVDKTYFCEIADGGV